jgi:hypothetical protein
MSWVPLRLLVVVLAVVLLVAGCRLTADQGPRRIPSEQLPADLVDPTTTTTTVASAVGRPAQAGSGWPSPPSSASRLLAQSATGSSATRS